MGLMVLWANDFRAVFWVAVIPGGLAVVLLLFGVREPERPPRTARLNPVTRANLARLGAPYWRVVAMGAIFMLARFSEAFLLLRALQGGLPVAYTPLVLVAMNLVYSVGAYPFGKLADRVSHTALLAWGLAVLAAADLLLASSSQWPAVAAGIALWGLHMAMTQGLLATMVADTAPAELRGTAFGFFNLVSGLVLLLASTLAGVLWDQLGAPATFAAGAAFCAAALLLLGAWRNSLRLQTSAPA
jgi:predicted MFS family arabinose efflux permease